MLSLHNKDLVRIDTNSNLRFMIEKYNVELNWARKEINYPRVAVGSFAFTSCFLSLNMDSV